MRAMRRVRRLMAASRPGAIHCCKCLPEGLVALLARRGAALPVWCFAHGEELTLAETSRELKWLTTFVLRRVTHVIANSRHTRGLLVDRWGVPPDSITVMTPGVDTARFVPAPPDADWRQQMGWTGRRVILTIGALQKRKGQDMLIRALPSIRRQCPNVLYAVGGEGWEREYLERLAADTGVAEAVQFLGTPEETDLVKLYQQCDLFALPNRTVRWNFEGFGIVLLEAQSCAKAVVTGTSGGSVETMIPGETGLSVPCDAPEQLAAACVQLLEEPGRRARMGESGRAWVVQQFDWQALARQARELFSGVA
jgi:phosphatidylinositol alpha-1,6-mannosyltransferase